MNLKLIPSEAILGGREGRKQYKGSPKSLGSGGLVDGTPRSTLTQMCTARTCSAVPWTSVTTSNGVFKNTTKWLGCRHLNQQPTA